MAIEYTQRGFRIYGRVKERDGGVIRVQESSIALEGAHVWLFLDERTCTEHMGRHSKPEPQINVAQAKDLIAALQAFVDDAEGGKLTEPATTQGGGDDA